jgi:hypothetical protein
MDVDYDEWRRNLEPEGDPLLPVRVVAMRLVARDLVESDDRPPIVERVRSAERYRVDELVDARVKLLLRFGEIPESLPVPIAKQPRHKSDMIGRLVDCSRRTDGGVYRGLGSGKSRKGFHVPNY